MAKQVLHNIEVSTLGFGGTRWAMEEGNNERIDRKKGFALIDAALERGINYFDTAHAYLKGDSEPAIPVKAIPWPANFTPPTARTWRECLRSN